MKLRVSAFLAALLTAAWMLSAEVYAKDSQPQAAQQNAETVVAASKEDMRVNVAEVPIANKSLSGTTGLVDADAVTETATLFSQSPWFALVSGLASILALLIPLYATQVKPLPFSLYRSLMWKKQLSIAGGVGLAVFAGISFFNLEGSVPRIFEIINLLANIKNGYLSYPDRSAYVLLFWLGMLIFGINCYFKAANFDPVIQARKIIIREQAVIEQARAEQVSTFLRGRNVDELPKHELRTLREIMDYYRYVQWRYVDVVLGAPPVTFPIFREDQRDRSDTDQL